MERFKFAAKMTTAVLAMVAGLGLVPWLAFAVLGPTGVLVSLAGALFALFWTVAPEKR